MFIQIPRIVFIYGSLKDFEKLPISVTKTLLLIVMGCLYSYIKLSWKVFIQEMDVLHMYPKRCFLNIVCSNYLKKFWIVLILHVLWSSLAFVTIFCLLMFIIIMSQKLLLNYWLAFHLEKIGLGYWWFHYVKMQI